MSPGRASSSLELLLETATSLARAAGEVTLRHFGARIRATTKADGTPVTRADREAEELLRSEVRRLYPDHGFLGEEFGEELGRAPIRWIVDPIDGTRSFQRGVPLYAVLLGIEVEGEAAVGVAHFPALGQTVSAARGLGCFLDGRPCRVSDEDRLRAAVALTTDVEALHGSPAGPGWEELARHVDYTRTWGDAYGHALVATGRADIMVDPELAPWDAAPLLPLLVEAGGRFTDLGGNATIHGGSGISTNARLHDRVLALLGAG